MLLSSTGFGAMAIFARVAYDTGAEPIAILPWRFGIAAAVLAAMAALRRSPLPERRRLVGLLAAGGIGYTAQAICFFTALEHASAGLVALLLYLHPALVAILAVTFMRERFTARRAGGVALALAGTALTIGPLGSGSQLGVALGLGAAAVYSIYIVVNARLTRGVDPIVAAALICLGATTTSSILGLLVRPAAPTGARGWLAVVAIALASTVLAISLYFVGLQRLGPTDAATVSTFEPVVTVALAAVVLHETITPLQLIGGAVILAAVVILARAPARRSDDSGPDDPHAADDRGSAGHLLPLSGRK